jgi:methylmalonyl-CoA mutase, N-terminal domain
VTTARDRWQAAFDHAERRDADFDTMSGLPVAPVYGPDDGQFPGEWPYTRGPYASMYRSKLWTMRMFAGFGTAPDTNRRFRELLAAGGDGLSTAFDLPTLMGRDSDDPLSLGEVGKCGVAVDTLADMEDLYREIDLARVTTSMTINSPAAILLAMYVAVAERGGASRRQLGGTLQNDILKEYQAQKEFIFPPRPSAPPRCRAGTRSRCPGTTSGRPGAPPPRSLRSRWRTGSRTSRRDRPRAS